MATPARKMTPSRTGGIPFATGIVMPAPVIDKINRGLKALTTNYNLANRLRLTLIWEEQAWLMQLYHTDSAKPLVSITNKDAGAINRFLTECGRVIAKTYGEEATTKARRTA